ncbi:MAG: hypothetical protein Q9162_005633 [Coniocarpon cinnabarinum]
MDSPAFKAPVDPKEQPILDKLLYTRDQLFLVKQDKTKYVKSQDVVGYYEEICKQVEVLNEIRTSKPLEQNRLDTVLDDCLQLISLFFMTVGKCNEAPAAYSLVSTINRLLDHLKEAAFFLEKDIIGIDQQLTKIEESVELGRPHHHDVILTLLEARIATCRETLKELRQMLAPIPEDLMPLHEKLVSILRSLSGCNTRSKFPTHEVQDFQKQLQEISNEFQGRSVPDPHQNRSIEERLQEYANKIRSASISGTNQMPGREIIGDLLERNTLWSHIITTRQGKLDPRFHEQFAHLNSIRIQLEKLQLTQAWSLRETDLFSFQRKLNKVDEGRVHGNFVDDKGQPAELYEQRTLLYLLRRSYAFIYQMLTSSEPVSEALQPIYNQLSTLRKCLVEVKRSGGVSSARELYPYSMKLNSLDNMRHDGKFVVNGDIPEGQATVTALLHECFDMAYDLRNDAEQEKEAGRDTPNEDDDDEEERPVELKKPTTTPSQRADGADTGLTRTVSVK